MEPSLDDGSATEAVVNRYPRPLIVLFWAIVALFLVGLGTGAFFWFASIPGESFDSSAQ